MTGTIQDYTPKVGDVFYQPESAYCCETWTTIIRLPDVDDVMYTCYCDITTPFDYDPISYLTYDSLVERSELLPERADLSALLIAYKELARSKSV